MSKTTSTVVPNSELDRHLAKHGAPVRQKPHGSSHTVLYYPEAEEKKTEAPPKAPPKTPNK